jgi:hypothetical protein
MPNQKKGNFQLRKKQTIRAIKTVAKSLEKGTQVEHEHKGLYDFIQVNGLPAEETFYKMIALAHIQEDPQYYEKLERMENG